MNLSDFVWQSLARFIRVTSQPVIATTPGDRTYPRQPGHEIGGLLRLDELVSQLDSLAKKAAAFFKISFSIRSLRTSSRSFLISASRSSSCRPGMPETC